MKIKKSMLLLIALFSGSIECMKPHEERVFSEEWENIEKEKNSSSSENDQKDDCLKIVKNEDSEKEDLSSSASSLSSSDSENNANIINNLSNDDAQKKEKDLLSFSNLSSSEKNDSTDSGNDDDTEKLPYENIKNMIWKELGPVQINQNDTNDYDSTDSDSKINFPPNLHIRRRNVSFKILRPMLKPMPVAVGCVLIFFLHKLFSGPKKPRKQRPVGSFNNKTTHHHFEGDQRGAGSYS